MEKYVTIRMPISQAYEQGLLVCKCGHPTNNHFEGGTGACAFCLCLTYREKAKFGSLVQNAVAGEAESPDARDANDRRYRWLASQATFGPYPFGDPPAWRFKFPHIVSEFDRLENTRAALDRLVDAAMGSPTDDPKKGHTAL